MKSQDVFNEIYEECRLASRMGLYSGATVSFYTCLSLRTVVQGLFGAESKEFAIIDSFVDNNSHSSEAFFIGPRSPEVSH